jgi:predicted GH43/DUF377 family glycosyl hydrolase
MGVVRAAANPIIRPEDVKPSRADFEVIGIFNAGVARYRDEVVLLLRVAERPVGGDAGTVLCPIYDVQADAITIKPFARDDPRNDFSDPRLIVVSPARGSQRSRSKHPVRRSRARRPRHEHLWTLPVTGEQDRGGPATGEQGQEAPATETYLTSISHLRLARSADGLRFRVAPEPALTPANLYETFGLEDPRITCLDGTFYLDYVGVSPRGVVTCLAATRDFESFERRGIIFPPDNKDVVIFPERIAGRYYALHRPHSSLLGRNDIWLAESPDLLCWGNHRYLLGTRAGAWDERRIGAGTVPVRVPPGWLEIYHGADRANRYCLGAVLLDAEQPWRVLARSDRPLFEPQADYERTGFFGQVVFTCGLLREQDRLKVYYGAADTSICYAEIPLDDVYRNLRL